MRKKINCLVIFISCCGLCASQQVVSSGGHTVKSQISVDWILGGSLSDIPPNDIGTLSLLLKEQMKESENSLKVYPNPATDIINIEIVPLDTGRIILELYNNSGIKVLNKVVVIQPVLQINISDITPGIYFLKAFKPHKDQPFRVEKIFKN